MALLVDPAQIMLPSIVVTGVPADLKLPAIGKSTWLLEANVTSPRLSRPSANLSTKLLEACFSASHELLAPSDPDRSTTIATFTSRREVVADALTIVDPKPSHFMNIEG